MSAGFPFQTLAAEKESNMVTEAPTVRGQRRQFTSPGFMNAELGLCKHQVSDRKQIVRELENTVDMSILKWSRWSAEWHRP